MPVISGGQPTVSVQVPVPTPVQQPKRPVTFRPPQQLQGQVGPSGVPPQQPAPNPMSAVILPWGGVDDSSRTGKTTLRRKASVLKYGRVPYNDTDFTSLIKKTNPSLSGEIDPLSAGVTADWLQDRDDWRSHLFRTLTDASPSPDAKNRIRIDHGIPSWNEVKYDGSVPKACRGEYCEPLHVVQYAYKNTSGGGKFSEAPLVLVRSWYAVPHRNKPNDPTYAHYRLLNSVMTPEQYAEMRADAGRNDPGAELPEPPESHRPTAGIEKLSRTGKLNGVTLRRRPMSAVVRYSHEGFLSAITKKPKDFTSRAAYADWLEEHDPQSVGPKTLELLRNPNSQVWVSRTSQGQVIAGRKWTMPEIKAANITGGGKWFSRDNTRFFGTRLLPRHVYSGPGGVYFVHEGDNFDRTAREYRIGMFEPNNNGQTGSWSSFHREPGSGRDFANGDAHADLNEAVDLARQLAAGTSPYEKNSYYDPAKHGPAVEYPTPPPEPTNLTRRTFTIT